MTALDNITIRGASVADADALDRLAGRDSTRLPGDDFLIAEVAGEPVAAVGIRTRAVAADPFRPTAEAVELLHLRAERVRRVDGTGGIGPGLLRRLRTAA
jgi:hypothetical protein